MALRPTPHARWHVCFRQQSPAHLRSLSVAQNHVPTLQWFVGSSSLPYLPIILSSFARFAAPLSLRSNAYGVDHATPAMTQTSLTTGQDVAEKHETISDDKLPVSSISTEDPSSHMRTFSRLESSQGLFRFQRPKVDGICSPVLLQRQWQLHTYPNMSPESAPHRDRVF